jgi:hypothetical protein
MPETAAEFRERHPSAEVIARAYAKIEAEAEANLDAAKAMGEMFQSIYRSAGL